MGAALQKCIGAPAVASTSRDLPTNLAAPPYEPAPAIPADTAPLVTPAPPLNGNGMADKGGVNGAPAEEHFNRISSIHEEPGLQQPVLTPTSIVHKPPPLETAGPWEDVNWLNAFLQQGWPSLNEAASKVARESIDAILKQYQPDAIELLRVKSLDLGEVPPVFKEVRIRTEHEPDEILLDVKLDWTEGRPTMVLEIKPRFSFALAIKLKDLDLVAWTRIAFKPLTGVLLPCFGAMTIALQEEPYVNFQIEALGGVTNLIPGLGALIDSTVKGAIVDALLWPNRIVVPIIPREDNYKDLLFWPSGELRISSIACADLPTMRSLTDVAGVPDPIVWFYVRKKADRIIKTTPKTNDRHPKWDDELKVMVEDPALQDLTVVVMDQEVLGRATFIGMAVVPLAGIADGEERNISHDLHVEAFFMPEAQKAKAKNADQLRGKISFKMLWHKYLPEEVPPVPAPVPPKAPEMQPAPDTVSDIPVAAPVMPAPTEK